MFPPLFHPISAAHLRSLTEVCLPGGQSLWLQHLLGPQQHPIATELPSVAVPCVEALEAAVQLVLQPRRGMAQRRVAGHGLLQPTSPECIWWWLVDGAYDGYGSEIADDT